VIVAIAVVGLLLVLGALVLAPRMRIFDRKEARLAFLIGATVVVLVFAAGATTWAHHTAESRARAASNQLLAALEAVPPSSPSVGPGGLPGVTRVTRDGDAWVAFRPVEVLWMRWCVVGHLDAGGRAAVQRVHRACPQGPDGP
jgi:hypothetical protein